MKNQNITKNSLLGLPAREKIVLECEVCSEKFTRVKSQVLKGLKHQVRFCCSKRCSTKLVDGEWFNCINCQKLVYRTESSIRPDGRYFCSKHCSGLHRKHSEETKEKIRVKANENLVSTPLVELITRRINFIVGNANKRYRTLRLKSWDELGFDGKRKRVIEEQSGTCLNCGLSEWLGEPIRLEVDHIDGKNLNNERSNLRGLCPNCHSLTDTWKGRNRGNNRGLVSDTELLTALESKPTIRQALISVGMSPRGGNYTRATRLKARLYE